MAAERAYTIPWARMKKGDRKKKEKPRELIGWCTPREIDVARTICI